MRTEFERSGFSVRFATVAGLCIVILTSSLGMKPAWAQVWGLKSRDPAGAGPDTTPTHLFWYEIGQSTVVDLGAVTDGASDLRLDGLATSSSGELFAYVLDGADSQLVTIDPLVLPPVAVPVGPQLMNREIRGAVFVGNQLFVIDEASGEMLEIDSVSGVPVLPAVQLRLSGAPFATSNVVDLAVTVSGELRLVTQYYRVLSVNPTTGDLTLLYENSDTDSDDSICAGIPSFAGATFSDAVPDLMFGYDISCADDLFTFDTANGYLREKVVSHLLPTFNSGRGDLAAIVTPTEVRRGDCVGDSVLDLQDVLRLAQLVQPGVVPTPDWLDCSGSVDPDVLDVNDNEVLTLADLLLVSDIESGLVSPAFALQCRVDLTGVDPGLAIPDPDYVVNVSEVEVVGDPDSDREVRMPIRVRTTALPIRGFTVALSFGSQLAPESTPYVSYPGIPAAFESTWSASGSLFVSVGALGSDVLAAPGGFVDVGELRFTLPAFAVFPPVQWILEQDLPGFDYRATVVDSEYADHRPELSSGSFEFARGNANNSDAAVDVADAVYVLDYLFMAGSTPECQDAADVNDDGAIDIADAIQVLCVLFAGCTPFQPYPVCGFDVNPDLLQSTGCICP